MNKKLKRSMESSILFYSFDAASVFHQDYYTLLVLDEYLLGGMSSKLFKELREKNAYVYGLGSAMNAYAKEGSYILIVHTLKKNLDKVKVKIKGRADSSSGFLGLRSLRWTPLKSVLLAAGRLVLMICWSEMSFLAENEILGEEDFGLGKQIERLNEVDSKMSAKVR